MESRAFAIHRFGLLGLAPALLNIGSMSPPGYPSAWSHPCRARLRLARQVHCSSATPCCSQLPACSSPGNNRQGITKWRVASAVQ
jgi:hypothetical protein